jgi:pimeloyl-ACP methyl ester carboxylesterase
MERVRSDVGALHVESHGAGPALLCWPSLFCDSRTLRPLVDEFSRDHRLLLVDGPGHGSSGGTGRPFSLEDCADAAMRILDAAGVERAVWLGAAWGGHVGVAAALRYPDRLRALAAMNAPMGPRSVRRRAFLWSTWWLLRLSAGSRVLARKIASAQIAPARLAEQPGLVDPIVDCIVTSERRPFLAAVRSAMLDRPSLVSRLAAIRVPTLFITGSEDGLFTVAEAREQAAAIPGARFEIVTGTAHQSLWEDPGQVVPKLRAFVSEVERVDMAPPRGDRMPAGLRGDHDSLAPSGTGPQLP